MKTIFSIIFSSLISFSINAQLQLLSSSNYLLVGPKSSSCEDIEIINYYSTEYFILQKILNEKLLSKTNKLEIENLEQDLKLVKSYRNLWSEEYKNNGTTAFTSNYKKDKCYELETDFGIKQHGEFTVVEQYGDLISIREMIPVEEVNIPGKWVRKKKPDCLSENPADCDISCYEKAKKKYILDPDELRFETTEIPENFIFDELNKVIEQENVVAEAEFIIIDKELQLELKIISWRETICN